MGPTGLFDRKLAVGGEWGRIPMMEVVMRPPEVFVRSLSHQEAVKLKRMSTPSGASGNPDSCGDFVGVERQDAGAADRPDVVDRRESRAQGDP